MRIRTSSLLIKSLIFGFLVATRVWAATTTADQAATVVTNWLSQNKAHFSSQNAKTIKSTQIFNDNQGSPVYYVVNLNPTGFAIVPGDDGIEPVVAFVENGEYSANADNPLGALVMADLPARMKCLRDSAIPPGNVSGANAKWTKLQQKSAQVGARGLSGVPNVSVAPLLQSQWGQSTVEGPNNNSLAVWNYYTAPFNTPGSPSNDPCGCAPLAMAQFMNFMQYPINGVGQKQFLVTATGSPETRSLLGGDGAGGPYDWNSMPDCPDSSITMAQCQSLGRLAYDCGVATDIDYETWGSGTTMNSAASALTDTFQFSNAMLGASFGNEGLTLTTGLTQMLNPNLDAGCPLLLGIYGQSGGHAVVCDGYGQDTNQTMYHHLNMGWTGMDNAWYALPDIDAAYQFNVILDCVYNIYKSGTGEIVSGTVTDNSGQPLSGAIVYANVSGSQSGSPATAVTNANGIYALINLSSATSYVLTASLNGYSFTTQNVTTGTSVQNTNTCGNVWSIKLTGTTVSEPPVITSSLTDTAIVGRAYQYQITASNFPTSYAAPNLPDGLFLDTGTGIISGTPATYDAGPSSIAITATNAFGTGTATLAITFLVPAQPIFASQPTATPNPAGIGQTVTFSATGSSNVGDTLVFSWDFADGSQAVGQTVNHTYTAGGDYTVTVAMSDLADPQIGSVSQQLILPVSMPGQPLGVNVVSIKICLASGNLDSLVMQGEVPIPDNWQPNNQNVLLTIGNLSQQLTLNKSGKASANGCALKFKGSMSSGAYTGTLPSFSVTIKNQNLLPIFTNGQLPAVGTCDTLPITLALGGVGHGAQVAVSIIGSSNVMQATSTKSKPKFITLHN
jgi:hypothetical protein